MNTRNMDEISDYDKGYAQKIAEHLANNYDKGYWDFNMNYSFSLKDFRSLQEVYYNTVSDAKQRYQKELNDLMLRYLRLKKLRPEESRITFSKFREILHYKIIYRSKKAIRDYLYE